MTLNSMTGFARSQASQGASAIVWELKSVNGKAFDVRFRLPMGLDHLEASLRETLGTKIKRGNVQASLSIASQSQQGGIKINQAVLQQYLLAAAEMQKTLGGGPPRPEALLALKGVVEAADETISEDEAKLRDTAVMKAFVEAAESLVVSRRDEGQRIAKTIETMVARIASLTAEAEANPARQPQAIRQRLKEQIEKLIDTGAALDPDRLHQEAILQATRVDIAEEIDRLKTHVAAARVLLKSAEPMGRKFDFLAQEFNREANTLCSKSNDSALTATGLELKTVIDQLREQVQNIE
ncbi:MAG: YicC/YloC family endoribonuclease [Aestuariivirga sp.]